MTFSAPSNAVTSTILPAPLPRSVYAGRLGEFPDFTFSDRAAFGFRGRWRDFFRRRIGQKFDGRVILEIGCYNAGFLSKIAAKFPETGFVGLDWKCKAIYDGAGRVAGLGLKNVALLRARGQEIVQIFGECEIDEIWAFFPDPCDAGVELKSRLIDRPFLADVHRTLRDSHSVLSFKTDHLAYYQWIESLFDGAGQNNRNDSIGERFEVTCKSNNFWHDPPALSRTSSRCFTGEVTTYESRFIKKRLPIHYFEIQKK